MMQMNAFFQFRFGVLPLLPRKQNADSINICKNSEQKRFAAAINEKYTNFHTDETKHVRTTEIDKYNECENKKITQ